MTLVLSLLNSDFAVQLSDRRLTNEGGVVTDEANKAVVVVTTSARVVMGYSGLAHVGAIDVLGCAIEALHDVGAPDYQWEQMVYRFADRMSELFSRPAIMRLREHLRCTSFHFIGHLRTDPPAPTVTYVSNWYDPANGLEAVPPAEEFRVSGGLFSHPDGAPRLVMPLGSFSHLGSNDFRPLDALLREKRPPEAIVGKGIELMRKWAEDPRAAGTIGKQISSVILPANGEEWGTAEYHPVSAQSISYMVDEVRALPSDSIAVRGGVFEGLDGSIAAVPAVGRNHPCPCGSGKKFKKCHGAPADPKRTLILELQRVRKEEEE